MGLPCGAYSESYQEDKAIFRTKTHWLLLALAFVLAATMPLYSGDYVLGIFNMIFVWIIAAHGLNLLLGYCGQISLGHAAFFGVGAYTSAFLTFKLGLPFWVSLPSAIVVAALLGLMFGLPSLRLKGFYLALATLAAQFILEFVFLHWVPVTGGYNGIQAPPITLGGIEIAGETSWFYFLGIFVVIATYAAHNLARSRTGRAFVAVRDNDLAAEVMGVNVSSTKITAFAVASAFAGAGGALWAHYLGHVFPTHFDLFTSIWFLGMLIIGGLGRTTGVFFGVFVVRWLEQGGDMIAFNLGQAIPWLGATFFVSAAQLFFAIVLILFIVLEPRGIAHRWEILKSYYRLWPFPY